MDQPVDENVKIAHLTMLQGVIARMGANSFTLKALSASFGSAAIAVMATADKPSPYHAISALIPIAVFWLMDAQYLKYERAYRKLFERVRKNEHLDPYCLDAGPFMGEIGSVIKIAVTWSVFSFYVPLIIVFGIVAVILADRA